MMNYKGYGTLRSWTNLSYTGICRSGWGKPRKSSRQY